MKTLFTGLFLILFFTGLAQSEKFDITSYTPPKGWKKTITTGALQFSNENKSTGAYCVITLYQSLDAGTDAKKNFDLAWASLVKGTLGVSVSPVMQAPAVDDGWDARPGYASFDASGTKGMVILVTTSGFGKMINIIILTNTTDYQHDTDAFLESVHFTKPVVNTVPVNNGNGINGTWLKTGSINPEYSDPVASSLAGYTTDQYEFGTNGTYRFYSKTFCASIANILLVRENGTYQVNGKNLTLTPQKSVIEGWSKKGGGDKFGSLQTTQVRSLEKTTYQFTKYYFSGIQKWNLVLQADQATRRDGPFSNNKTFSNAWYYTPVSVNNIVIDVPGR